MISYRCYGDHHVIQGDVHHEQFDADGAGIECRRVVARFHIRVEHEIDAGFVQVAESGLFSQEADGFTQGNAIAPRHRLQPDAVEFTENSFAGGSGVNVICCTVLFNSGVHYKQVDPDPAELWLKIEC